MHTMLGSSKLFKYVSGESHHTESIEQCYFYFSRVKQVNDPEDCKVNPSIDLSNVTKDDIIQFVLRYGVLQIEAEILANKLLDNPSIAATYVQAYEASNKIEDERFRNTVKILCLTDKPDDVHMWKEYARKNNPFDGYCIGYACIPVNSIRIINDHSCYRVPLLPDQIAIGHLKPDFHVATQVFYGEATTIAYNPFKSNKEDLVNSYYYKREMWSQEKEFRCVLDDTMTTAGAVQKIHYAPDLLASVIFGEHCPADIRKSVREAVKKSGSSLVTFHVARDSGGSVQIAEE
ncbi:hypothetical protein LEP1GSC175_1913 [Leptospira santarosai str. HAI821]|uniref:hypothetical protein n=1 Tax=Leptospira santarosai TaxID=28183 RepID=UPI0002BEB47D|nr:hypothetical protein [Leptospira santarosai]EMO33306.1 hypothetical protein LEP1GSC175_1913 [Leptospira santarosai str. HAI821]